MFENPRRGRQARNFTTNVPKILDLKWIPNRYFPKIDVGCAWIKLPIFPKMGNVGLFQEFKNYKMVTISCYTFLFFFISACAPVLLWRLAIALEQMLPAGEVYFRPVTSRKPPRKPRVRLILYSGLQFFHSFLWVSRSLLDSFFYLEKLR